MARRIRYSIFEWDEKKESENRTKHHLDFREATKAFEDPKKIWVEDKPHSGSEMRWFCIGRIGKKIITLRITFRWPYIRIFGAGFWRKGKKIYEEKNTEETKNYRTKV